MTARAVLTLTVQDGLAEGPSLRFHGDGAPEFIVPAIADFYTWACDSNIELSADTYLRYAAEHGALPVVPFTDPTMLTPVRVRELCLDYLYDLTLAANEPGLRLQVYDRSRWTRTQKRSPVQTLTQADLYEAAAAWCDLLARRAEQYAGTHEGLTLPGGEPSTWTGRAAGYRRRHQAPPALAAHANAAATYYPPTFDVAYPSVQVGGVMVFVYVNREGRLRVSVDLDETEPWLIDHPKEQVRLVIGVNGIDVF